MILFLMFIFGMMGDVLNFLDKNIIDLFFSFLTLGSDCKKSGPTMPLSSADLLMRILEDTFKDYEFYRRQSINFVYIMQQAVSLMIELNNCGYTGTGPVYGYTNMDGYFKGEITRLIMCDLVTKENIYNIFIRVGKAVPSDEVINSWFK